jgi:hypothetical protein
MSNTVRWLLCVSALVLGLSWVSFRFGPQYDRGMLSTAELAFYDSCCVCDPVGARWEKLGLGFILLAAALLIATFRIWSQERVENNRYPQNAN